MAQPAWKVLGRMRRPRWRSLLLAGLLAVLMILALGGCAGRAREEIDRPPPSLPSPAPAPPPAAAPARPALRPGDVLAGLAEGESAPRICFRAGKWREILEYLIALEAHAGEETRRLRSHIEKLERRIAGMIREAAGR